MKTLSPMKFGIDYAQNTGNQHYRRRKWNSGIKSFVEEEIPYKHKSSTTPKDKHHPREYRSGSWPYWRRLSAYFIWNLSGAWYAYQLWERVVHHQIRADVSKNFGPMGTQAVELSTKNHVFVKTDTLKFVTYVFVHTNIPNMFRHFLSVYIQTVSVSVSD